MVIFYNKRVGNIKAVFSGDLQTMENTFGTEAEDYAQILDCVTFPDDYDVIRQPRLYKINIDTKQIEAFPLKYPIAQEV